MFVYCTEVLHLSEYAAYLCIAVARAARTYPILLEMLRDGRLHLTAIKHIVPLLLNAANEAKREEILRCATHKSKREIEQLVARLKPQPDVATTIRKLAKRRGRRSPKPEGQLGLDQVGRTRIPVPSQDQAEVEQVTMPASVPSVSDARVQAISPVRYKVTFTASAESRDKLDRLRELTRASHHGGDLAAIIEEAITEKLDRVEARRLGKVKSRPKSMVDTDTSAGSRHIPAAVKRAVSERDADRCTFVNSAGKRCRERAGLEGKRRRR